MDYPREGFTTVDEDSAIDGAWNILSVAISGAQLQEAAVCAPSVTGACHSHWSRSGSGGKGVALGGEWTKLGHEEGEIERGLQERVDQLTMAHAGFYPLCQQPPCPFLRLGLYRLRADMGMRRPIAGQEACGRV